MCLTISLKTALKIFSSQNSRELKIIIIDNAGFHARKNSTIPHKIKFIRISPCALELNPVEKGWRWIKNKAAVKLFKQIKTLKNKITELVGELNLELRMLITGYELYTKTFLSKFKV